MFNINTSPISDNMVKSLPENKLKSLIFVKNFSHRPRRKVINSASFKDSSVVGQNYQRAHQGCS